MVKMGSKARERYLESRFREALDRARAINLLLQRLEDLVMWKEVLHGVKGGSVPFGEDKVKTVPDS